ncbi:MAG TPA: glycosyltransferase, partial [Anaerolineae bacterium]|nr:glycosyltransferase [Anaerolineae bacterium]
RVFVVPNGKDVTIPPRRRQGGPVRVLFLANMMRTKGVLEVLYAVPEVVQRFPNVEFVFAGAWRDADVRDEVTGFLESHPDLPISWLGPVTGEEKYQLLADSDIFVFPTYYPPEGHPWVIVEAMAAGLPIVTCDQGAIRESVIDGYNGFLVEKRNPRAVAETLIQLASQTHLRHALGASSRRLYQLFFTEAAMAYKLRHVFDYVLIARPRRPSTA